MSVERRTRPAFTLTELVVALAISSVLVAGLSSTLFIAIRAADPNNVPAAQTLDGLTAISEMSAELQFALEISEDKKETIVFTVPDRNGDSVPETVRYDWSKTKGDPLTRQLNSRAEVNAVDSVEDFELTYYKISGEIKYVTIELQTTDNDTTFVESTVLLWNEPL